MAQVGRAAGVLPLIGALVAAASLAGAAVFTVSQAACPNPGHYEHAGMTTTLVGGCVSRDELPGPNGHPQAADQDRSGPAHSQP